MKNLFLFLFLAVISLSSQAAVETIPSTLNEVPGKVDSWSASSGGTRYPTAEHACQAQSTKSLIRIEKYFNSAGQLTCWMGSSEKDKQGFTIRAWCDNGKIIEVGDQITCGTVKKYTCPDSSWTLSQDQLTCTREKKECKTAENVTFPGTYTVPAGDLNGKKFCINGCLAFGPHGEVVKTDTTVSGSFSSYGQSCPADGVNVGGSPGGTDPTDPTDPKPEEPKPEEPKITKTTETETFSDGSTKTTESVTTCIGNKCTTVKKTTTTPGSNGQPGQAGTPGSSTNINQSTGGGSGSGSGGSGSGSGSGSGGEGEGEGLPEDIATESTQKKVFEELEKINKPKVEDDSALQEAGKFKQTDEQKQEDQKYLDLMSGSGADSRVEEKKSAYAAAMSSGWFDPVPFSSCIPPRIKVPGYGEVAFDFCGEAKILSEVMKYALYFYTVIGFFVALTGGKKVTS